MPSRDGRSRSRVSGRVVAPPPARPTRRVDRPQPGEPRRPARSPPRRFRGLRVSDAPCRTSRPIAVATSVELNEWAVELNIISASWYVQWLRRTAHARPDADTTGGSACETRMPSSTGRCQDARRGVIWERPTRPFSADRRRRPATSRLARQPAPHGGCGGWHDRSAYDEHRRAAARQRQACREGRRSRAGWPELAKCEGSGVQPGATTGRACVVCAIGARRKIRVEAGHDLQTPHERQRASAVVSH